MYPLEIYTTFTKKEIVMKWLFHEKNSNCNMHNYIVVINGFRTTSHGIMIVDCIWVNIHAIYVSKS